MVVNFPRSSELTIHLKLHQCFVCSGIGRFSKGKSYKLYRVSGRKKKYMHAKLFFRGRQAVGFFSFSE